jgi:hypothetical protein
MLIIQLGNSHILSSHIRRGFYKTRPTTVCTKLGNHQILKKTLNNLKKNNKKIKNRIYYFKINPKFNKIQCDYIKDILVHHMHLENIMCCTYIISVSP